MTREFLKVFSFVMAISGLLFSTSCTCWVKRIIPKDVRASLRYCYNSKPTGLDSIIPIHGFYVMKYVYGWPPNDIKLVFYPDGLFLYDANSGAERWGNYAVTGDTIKTYTYRPPCGMSWGGSEEWYVINDDKTLTMFYFSPMRVEPPSVKASYQEIRQAAIDAHEAAIFHPSDSLPDTSRCWLLKAKWFRCKEGN